MNAPPDTSRKIQDALRAIADGTPVAWRDLEMSPADSRRLEGLRLIEDVAAVFRADAEGVVGPDREVLFRWGGLEAEQLIGKGSYGEVYRAFDPWLGRHVALKLLGSGTHDGLDEARRLARLRHRNVLSIYGCGVHDNRAGLWSELIEGRTLAAAITSDGAFSAEETLRIGRDLAQALVAVHAAGLVHGDVKAENVMRENGGRVVLMDFGAGGDARLLAGRRLISGTPRYLPPEVLDGAALDMGSDLYALGMLLFLLLGGRYPYQATDPAVLREEQRGEERPALHTLRPDVDAGLCKLIESCIATDPAQRHSDASALAIAFSELLGARNDTRTGPRLPIAALVTACAALIGVGVLLLWPRLVPPAWESGAQFVRVTPYGNVEIAANSPLRVGDRLRLRLRTSRAAYVYVLNEDAAGNATVLFPLPGETGNPVHGGDTLTLPGGDHSTLAWEVTADSAREEFVVIAALTPPAELDAQLAAWTPAQDSDDTRSVGAVVNAPAPELRGEHLRQVLAKLPHDAQRIRVWHFLFPHAP